MPQAALTDRLVKHLEPPESGQVTYWDEGTPGFGVRISQGGSRSFVVVYGANRTRKTIGRYPSISLKQARDQAKKLVAEVTLGLDQKRSITWKEARKRFLADCEAKNKPNTVSYYRKRLDTHFKLGNRNLSDITRQDIQNRIRRINTSLSEQHHAFVAIRTLMNWAVREEYLENSPVGNMSGYKAAKARERVLSEAELKEVFQQAIRTPYPHGNIVQFLVLTGLRRTECSLLRWDWIDQKERLVTIPSEVTKNGKTHILPIGELLSEAIEQTPHTDEYLFPSQYGKGPVFNGWGKAKQRFDEGLQNVEPYTLHDLRRTFATVHAKIGTPIHVTEKLLNHVSGTISGVAAVYNRHSYVDEMRQAMQKYDEFLDQLVNS